MKRVAIILSLLTILSACVFNIKIPPEENIKPTEPIETEQTGDSSR